MVTTLVDSLIRWRVGWLVLAAVLFGFAWSSAQKLSFNRRIESMFPVDDPRYVSYQQVHDWFGNAETTIIAYDDPELFSELGLARLQQLHNELLAVPGVAGVVSLNQIRRPSAPLDSRTLLQQLEQGAVSADSLRGEVVSSRLYRERLVSASGESAILWVELERDDPDAGIQTRASALAKLSKICLEHRPVAMLAGGPVLVDEVFTVLEQDGVTLGLASSLILTLVILVLFKNLRWVLLPLLVVQLAVVMTKGALQISGLQMTMVSSPLVALVTVIGVATVVHLTVRYREERQSAEAVEALRKTLTHVGPAIFWTCVTTLLGFAALQISHVGPVRNFGLMMSIGSGMVLAATILLTAGCVLLLPRLLSDRPGEAWFERGVTAALGGLIASVKQNPGRLLLALALVLIWGVVGISRIEVATDFNENFRQSSQIVKSFDFLRERIEGINALDVIFTVPADASVPMEETLGRLRELQRELELNPRVAQTLSVAEILDMMPGKSAEIPDEDSPPPEGRRNRWLPTLPSFQLNISDSTKLATIERFEPGLVGKLWNRNAQAFRVIVQVGHAPGSQEKLAVVETIEQISRKHFPDAQVTGIYVMMVYLVQHLLADQWTTFGLSLALILITMSWAFRSLTLAVLALIPNVAPIVLVVGAMGWWGLKMNMASAMIASVSLGLSVDFSIHYLWRFKEEFRKTSDVYEALRCAHGSVGLSMVLANLALTAGFLVLLASSLLPTVHFGLLVTVAMLGGLIGNLAVLPMFLRWRYAGKTLETSTPA